MNKALLTALLLLAGLFISQTQADTVWYTTDFCREWPHNPVECDNYNSADVQYLTGWNLNPEDLYIRIVELGHNDGSATLPWITHSWTSAGDPPVYTIDVATERVSTQYTISPKVCPENQKPDIVTGQCVLMDGHHCPAGTVYDSVTQSCVSECRAGYEWDHQLQTCLCSGQSCVNCLDRDSCLVAAHNNCFDQGNTLETFTYVSEGNFQFTCISGAPDFEFIELALSDIQADTGNIADSVNTANQSLNGISTELSQVHSKVDQLIENQVPLELEEQFTAIDGNFTQVKDRLNSMDGGLHSHISSVGTQVTDSASGLHTALGNLSGQLGNAEGGLHQHLGAVEGGIADIKNELDELLTGDYTGPLPEDFESSRDATLDDLTTQLTDTFNMTEEELGGRPILATDDDFIETFIGRFNVSQCQNPVILGDKTLDICSKASTINETLYYIFAALTLIAIWHELHSVARRNT